MTQVFHALRAKRHLLVTHALENQFFQLNAMFFLKKNKTLLPHIICYLLALCVRLAVVKTLTGCACLLDVRAALIYGRSHGSVHACFATRFVVGAFPWGRPLAFQP